MCSCGCCSNIIDEVAIVCDKYERDVHYLIPLMHDLQDKYGYISNEMMQIVADNLCITAGRVHSVATFYSMFYTKPHGKNVVRLCDSPPCHLEGSNTVRNAISVNLGIEPGETTEDNNFTLEIVSCMGLCGVAPAMMINDEVYGNLKPEMIPSILKKYKEGK